MSLLGDHEALGSSQRAGRDLVSSHGAGQDSEGDREPKTLQSPGKM